MGDTEGVYENATETQEVVTVPKKPRSNLQLAALEAARKKAYSMRAEKSALKKQDEASKAIAKVEAQKITLDTTQHPKEPPQVEEDEEEEPEVIYRKKPPKKKKRVVVVQEESSSDSEIEVRLPKAKKPPIVKPKNPDEIRYERAYNTLLSVDNV
jgi:hypothetical protein|eukprot:7390750-Prymnesium_polylepis.2